MYLKPNPPLPPPTTLADWEGCIILEELGERTCLGDIIAPIIPA
jgi:hypothetical protein